MIQAKDAHEIESIKNFARKTNISRAELIEIIANTKYCRHWAEGLCRFAGLKPGSEYYERCVERLSRKLARRLI